MKNKYFLPAIIVLLAAVSLVLAAHTITPSSLTVLEDTSTQYNITLNNSDIGTSANVSQFNVTIPSSFTFTFDTNATDAGANTFVNTSTVLSWTDNFLVNGSEVKHFTFNLTASTPGNYNLTITTRNATAVYNSNITVTVNDTNAPVITLLSPNDGASSTASAYNFTFNLTDEGTISNCSLIVDGIVINTMTALNSTGGENGMYNDSFSTATHYWQVNCTDTYGNTANSSTRSFTVTAEAVATVSEETSGGSSNSRPTYTATPTKLAEGYTLSTLRKDYKVRLNLQEMHTFNVDSITTNAVTFTISSTPQTATLNVGETGKYDLNDNGYYDLSVYVQEINSGKVTMTFKSINEQVTRTQDTANANTDAQQQNTGATQNIIPGSSSRWIIWIIALIIIVAVIAFFMTSSRKKGSSKRK